MPSNVQVELAIEDGLPHVHVDPDQVGQILVNLFTNATQAMDNQPGVLRVYARNGDGRVRIEVRDTGPGVPPELADKIFEPCITTKARGHRTRAVRFALTGRCQQRTRCRSANHPDGGAVFTLDLPAVNHDDGQEARGGRRR